MGAETHCGYVDVDYGALEARCGRADEEVWRYGGLECQRLDADVATWRHGGVEDRWKVLR